MKLVSVDNWAIEGPFWVGWGVGVNGNTISQNGDTSMDKDR